VAPITSGRPPAAAGGTPAVRSAGTRSLVGLNTTLTNVTGHPGVVVRNGVNAQGRPTSMTFIGNIYAEAKMLRLAHAYQMATNWHELHPTLT
jgi:Asp-tRNA(Asn)/Glu-tRNA(Gln) amidotransferase A subunit family amidase